MHLVLLGDSTLDNRPYTDGGPAVIDHVVEHLGEGSTAFLLAVDGDMTRDVERQLNSLPPGASRLVLSVGGNDALALSDVLARPAVNVSAALSELADVSELLEIQRYGSSHRRDLAMPPWRFWSDTFGFLLRVANWAERAMESEGALEVVASRARDIVLDCVHTFDLNGIRVPDPRRYRGTEFLFGLRDTVRVLCDWLEGEV